MNTIKCNNGHLYDADKFTACPHCSNMKAGMHISNYLGKEQGNISTVISKKNAVDNPDAKQKRKTVGFLVCIRGEMVGEGFLLREGINDIGRASNMDVILAGEASVSRNRHASILFDNKTGTFRLLVADGKQDVFCNGEQILRSCIIENRALIQIGECVLSFLAFCDASFTWYISES